MADALLGDPRTIIALTAQTHDETNYWKVGERGCRSIVVEAVNGQYASMPWFAIEGEKDFCRVNSAFVFAVDYANAT